MQTLPAESATTTTPTAVFDQPGALMWGPQTAAMELTADIVCFGGMTDLFATMTTTPTAVSDEAPGLLERMRVREKQWNRQQRAFRRAVRAEQERLDGRAQP